MGGQGADLCIVALLGDSGISQREGRGRPCVVAYWVQLMEEEGTEVTALLLRSPCSLGVLSYSVQSLGVE